MCIRDSVWAEIDLEALRYNFREVKARAGALPLCAVVKADSYGHGAVPVSYTHLDVYKRQSHSFSFVI